LFGLAKPLPTKRITLQRISDGESEVALVSKNHRLAEFFGRVGISSYREFGFEQVVLVEGVTDVKVVQHFLSLFHEKRRFLVTPTWRFTD